MTWLRDTLAAHELVLALLHGQAFFALGFAPKREAGRRGTRALAISEKRWGPHSEHLLEDLREEFGLTYLFIGHDLSVVRHICHRVAVMYLGKIVEIGDCDAIFSDPRHPYTRRLLDAVPVADPRRRRERPPRGRSR